MRAKLEESAVELHAAELHGRRLQCANALHEMREFVRASRDAGDLEPAVTLPLPPSLDTTRLNEKRPEAGAPGM
jgi:hypothetical protein